MEECTGQPLPPPPGQLPPAIANFGFPAKSAAASAAAHVQRIRQQQLQDLQHQQQLQHLQHQQRQLQLQQQQQQLQAIRHHEQQAAAQQQLAATNHSAILNSGQPQTLPNGEAAPPLLLPHADVGNAAQPLPKAAAQLPPAADKSPQQPGSPEPVGQSINLQPAVTGMLGVATSSHSAAAAEPLADTHIASHHPAPAAAVTAGTQRSIEPEANEAIAANLPVVSQSLMEQSNDKPSPAANCSPAVPSPVVANGQTPSAMITPKIELPSRQQDGSDGGKIGTPPVPKTRSRSAGVASTLRTTREALSGLTLCYHTAQALFCASSMEDVPPFLECFLNQCAGLFVMQ